MTKPVTIKDLFTLGVAGHQDLVAYRILDQDVDLTYADVDRAAAALAHEFDRRSIGRGERIALLAESMPAWPIAYFAIVASGRVVVPILQEFGAADVATIVEHSEARLLLASRKHGERVGKEVAAKAGDDLMIESLEDISLKALANTEQTDSYQWPAIEPDDTAAIIYTSGTTGHSKGVVLSHGNITSNVESADTYVYIQPEEAFLSVLPLAHTYECTLGMILPFSRGACVTYLGKPASPTVLAHALQTVRPHHMLSVPQLIEKLVRARVFPALKKGVAGALSRLPGIGTVILRAAGKKLHAAFGGRLRFFGVGGAPLAPDVEKFLYKADFPYAIGYGLTETSPLLAGTRPHHNVLRSTGAPIEGTDIRIVEGEVQARGPGVMQGYFRDPERTAEVMTDDGYFRTGDNGEFDANGNLFIKGRIKTMILGANGENIYPEAIESVINQYGPVAESLVLQKGRSLVARVRLDYESLRDQARDFASSAGRTAKNAADGAAEAAGDIHAFAASYLENLRKEVNARLSSFNRVAEFVEQEEPLEKTPTLKIKRYLYT